ncbi:uncharacterized protein LOC108632498 [Ceratina calcarata]|uniref:Uncharacterized protein LOC108632498 n=1 Tax=Ceratina calcarata TaxID=156304 RepID=A0AAJ7SCE7_9HYME|nr:uncharacterized protein LOC108632498 [Ceratina calcarata]
MDVSTRNQNAFQANAQRKFYQWVLKWINAHGDEEMRDVQRPAKLDVPILASFLQAIGFKLVSFEKHNDPLVPNKNEINSDALEQKGTLKIAIECDASNMKAVLELGEITCQCPKPDHVKEASFWSVSGTGPTANIDNNIVQKVEETGSNLLPRLSKDVTRVLRDVSYRLFDTITCEPDVNRNIENNLNNSLNNLSNRLNTSKKDIAMIRSHTQPEIRLHTTNNIVKDLLETQSARTNSNSSINCAVSPVPSNTPTFKRQKTWDIEIDTEPRPSPPKVTSSPVLELYTSIGQIYLHENEDPANVADYIVGAQKNLEKALQMLVVKKPMLERRMTHDLSPNQGKRFEV